MTDLSVLLRDPAWLPHDYDPQTGRIQFVHLSRTDRASLAFLADCRADADNSQWVSADAVRQADPPAAPVAFLFHSAFCRSTLLVKAFETSGVATGLSEPAILNKLARLPGNAGAGVLLAPILALLARPMAPGERVVIKPSNVANALIAPAMQAMPGARAILLSGDTAAFLRSVAKKGLGGRIWARRLFAHNGSYVPLDIGLDARAMFELTDLQIAGLAWLQHRMQFAHLLAGPLAQRLATLDMEEIGAGKAQTLLRCARFWGVALTPENAATLAQGPVFARHAKLGADYAETMAQQARQSRSPVTDEEIGIVERWIEAIAVQMRPSIRAEQPLPD